MYTWDLPLCVTPSSAFQGQLESLESLNRITLVTLIILHNMTHGPLHILLHQIGTIKFLITFGQAKSFFMYMDISHSVR